MNAQDYLEIWSAASAEVLQQALGASFAVQWGPEDGAGPSVQEAQAGLWLQFTLSDPLPLKQAFWISPSDAVYLGQSFIGDPADPLAPLTPEYRDAVGELFRQIAGTAALALKARVGKECPVVFAGEDAPTFVPVLRARYRWSAPGCPPLAVHLLADSDFAPAEVTVPAPMAVTPQVVTAAAGVADPAAAAAPVQDTRNLELLLDMELEVAIRFGRREMMLRDILELNPGSVVDFEQRIEDPVELLLRGRVIGRGEVVVVDGNYGLRVTEISGARARLNSLGK